MTQQADIWSAEQVANLEIKIQALKEEQRKTYSIDFIRNAIKIVPTKIDNEGDFNQFKIDTELLFTLFPVKDEHDKFNDTAYLKAVANYKQELKKKYNLVGKGYYLAIMLPLGIAIGLPFGIPFKNLALGIPIGMCIGVAIGAALDQKAKKENRVI